MSRHKSYGRASRKEKKRNVLKRFERIDILKKLGKWDNKKATSLPKTPTK